MAENNSLVIEASLREGKENANQLRKKGMIPAVLYGHDTENVPLAVPATDFEKVYREAGESTIVDLKVNGKESANVIIHDIQVHNLKGNVIHADFYKVDMTQKITANVPIKFVGISPAVKEQGGTLVHPMSEVEVESLPADLPHEIKVDISPLDTFDDVLRVEDLNVDRDKVKVLAEPDAVVAMVQEPRSEEELEALEAAPVEADVSEVEGVAEEEEGEEGEEGAEEADEEKKEEAESAEEGEEKSGE